MRKALLVIALAISAFAGVTHANEDGYNMRGAHSDFGSAFVNGLVVFVPVAVLLCLFAWDVSGDWTRWRQKRQKP
jgi:hypothetical protein